MTATPLHRHPADRPAWDAARYGAACEACGHTWLVPEAAREAPCPCGRAHLAPADVVLPAAGPEQLVPVQVDRDALAARLDAHIGAPWFRFPGLRGARLAPTATLVWWPRWLVDGTVRGDWTAEVGFDYETKSTVEQLRGGHWVSVDQTEVRVRWEPRMGTLERRYDNACVEALDDVGPSAHRPEQAEATGPFDPRGLGDGLLLLPDHGPDQAWSGAEPVFRAAAGRDIEAAAGADHIRDVHLRATFPDLVWTLRLQPAWWLRYEGPDGATWPLRVDAVTGRTWGPVFAGTGPAWTWTAVLGGIGGAFLLFALIVGALGVVLVPLLAVAMVLGVVGLVGVALAPFPIASVWLHNRREARRFAGWEAG